MDDLQVRLRLAGRTIYERPVSFSPRTRFPKTGDVIEVLYDGRVVRANVTSSSPPIYREGGMVTYILYAVEPEQV